MPTARPPIHGYDHLLHGSDPIPGLSTINVTSAIYGGDMGGGGSIAISTGNVSPAMKFSQLHTNDLDRFKLKGGSSPYFAEIAAGYYQWLITLDFQLYPHLLAPGTDIDTAGDYGFFSVAPVWGGGLITAHSNELLVTPGETLPLVIREHHNGGFINLNGDIDDMEVVLKLNDVQNSDAAITTCTLYLVSLGDFLPDESTNIVP